MKIWSEKINLIFISILYSVLRGNPLLSNTFNENQKWFIYGVLIVYFLSSFIFFDILIKLKKNKLKNRV